MTDLILKQLDTLKAELDGYRTLPVEAMEQLRRFYRVGLTYTSNAIEGSTLTESETKVVLEDGLTVSGKPLRDHLDAVNHAAAFDWLWKMATDPERLATVEESDVLTLHRLIVKDQDNSQPGQYRSKAVFISGTEYLPPPAERIPEMMKRLLSQEWPDWSANRHPVDAAALLHWKLVTIHPFMDGNGRVSRLLLNLALLQSGYGLAQIPPVCRLDYISALAGSRDAKLSTDGAEHFVSFIREMAYEGLKDYLRLVRHLGT